MDNYSYTSVEIIEARLARKWAELEEQCARFDAAQHAAVDTESTRKAKESTLSSSVNSSLFIDSPEPAVDEVGTPSKVPAIQAKTSLAVNTTYASGTDLDKKRKRSGVTASSVEFYRTQTSSLSALPPIKKKSKAPVRPSLSKQLDAQLSQKLPSTAIVSPISLVDTEMDAGTGNALPEWYQKLRGSTTRKYAPGDRQKLDRLGRILGLIKEAKRPEIIRNKQASAKTFDEISEVLHELEFLKVKSSFIAQKRLLDDDRGLPQIFTPEYSGGVRFPLYIQDDAKLLWTRWYNQNFEQNLFIGIQNMLKSKTAKGKGPSIDPKFKKDWRYFGDHGLVNGQWWGSQLCAVRDGAHGSPQGGIAGVNGKGATSIVLSGDMYKTTDRDEGVQVWYSGTKSTPNAPEPTANTQLLIDSIASNCPVRVMRSSNLPNTNHFRPAKGFRYDGLYEVLDSQLVDLSAQHRLFHLQRLSGQTPIRWNGAEARPTKHEMDEYDLDMRKYGWKGGVPE
jgi:hypothetical protein